MERERELLVTEGMTAGSFAEFVSDAEPRLRNALTAAWGPDVGREATADALSYGWEHWDRIGVMVNPVGYLYRVGRDRARRMRSLPPLIAEVAVGHLPWVEPQLPTALARLSEKQRLVVALIHGYQWSFTETAEFLGVSKGTVQTHERRGLARLRKTLGVDA